MQLFLRNSGLVSNLAEHVVSEMLIAFRRMVSTFFLAVFKQFSDHVSFQPALPSFLVSLLRIASSSLFINLSTHPPTHPPICPIRPWCSPTKVLRPRCGSPTSPTSSVRSTPWCCSVATRASSRASPSSKRCGSGGRTPMGGVVGETVACVFECLAFVS